MPVLRSNRKDVTAAQMRCLWENRLQYMHGRPRPQQWVRLASSPQVYRNNQIQSIRSMLKFAETINAIPLTPCALWANPVLILASQ